MQINLNTFPVEILTGHYQVSGNLEVRGGNPGLFLNDSSFQVFSVHDATMTPLVAGSPVGPVKVPLLFVPKTEPHVLLVGNFAPKDAQLLPNRIRLGTVGTFRVIPPTAQEFYEPEVYGRGEGALFSVIGK